MNLHPEVEKEIDRLAKWYADHHKIGLSVRDDMRHVVEFAVEKEREECAKVCESRAGSGPYAESMGAHRILTSAADAIRRRGKP